MNKKPAGDETGEYYIPVSNVRLPHPKYLFTL